ncbi:hypothetical protein [Paractinoplanes brasiliensis]|uniref:Uncharacterized protein n=1 Tax=Paractinoplanes brasiliensis TaxID=52695 RepID=A0A4R6J9E6_9ACTN|nr:hypothetical protein [Actinoplanes brasiliensis]TDO32229.1 hypothetical protein C8E87_7683 [Actinoplanes brasiliensis]
MTVPVAAPLPVHHDLTVPAGDGVGLAGTLSLPGTPGPPGDAPPARLRALRTAC